MLKAILKERGKKFGIKLKVKLMDLYVLQELEELFQG
jgi:hypothetical protein